MSKIIAFLLPMGCFGGCGVVVCWVFSFVFFFPKEDLIPIYFSFPFEISTKSSLQCYFQFNKQQLSKTVIFNMFIFHLYLYLLF